MSKVDRFKSRFLRLVCVVAASLVMPWTAAYAQEAMLTGTVTDQSGGALPGVSVRAVHEASGNSFEAVTDSNGAYRIPARVGVYQVSVDLSGFASVMRTVTLLVGQEAVVNLQMALSALTEVITVTGDAPLLDVTQSKLGGNLDPQQVSELPVQGRNWQDLVVLAPGARINSVEGLPSGFGALNRGGMRSGGDFQLNIDGMQLTLMATNGAGVTQPNFSRDAIAEFQFVSSRFDATQGRSFAVQVNAVTKSGTNTAAGTFSGTFRDDALNAKDLVAKRVIPYQNQQWSGTFGGPILRDRMHFFGNYEFEREPKTAVYTTPYPKFNVDLNDIRKQQRGGLRTDLQFTTQTRLMVRSTVYRDSDPLARAGGATTTPMSAGGQNRQMNDVAVSLTHVSHGGMVNELKTGLSRLSWQFTNRISKASPLAQPGSGPADGNRLWGGPTVQLTGLTVGGGDGLQNELQRLISVRDDFTYSFAKGGRHTVRLGGEFLAYKFTVDIASGSVNGTLDARGGPIPANIESLFPDLFDATTWNYAAFSPLSVTWRQAIGNTRTVLPRYTSAAWLQDDWNLSSNLTLNLGVRYDIEQHLFSDDVEMLPLQDFLLPGKRIADRNNIGPRAGFNWKLNNRTVVRGGSGLYYGSTTSAYFTQLASQLVVPATRYDGRADFAVNPYNGPVPTFAQAVAKLCTPALEAGCFRNSNTNGMYAPNAQVPYSYQASIGMQRQLRDTMSVEADYVFNGFRHAVGSLDQNINLGFNPATGTNYPFSDVTRRPYPWWDTVYMRYTENKGNLHSLQTAFTKRMNDDGFQLSGTYTLSALWDAYPVPHSGLESVGFAVPADFGGEYSLGVSDQRHRATVNGILRLPYQFQLSGLYFYGSGPRMLTNWGSDLRNIGGGGEMRLRPDGTLIPRNNFVGDPLHRVDLRFQRHFTLGPVGVDGTVEVFNVFDHANYGDYVTTEAAANYGAPVQSNNTAFGPRAAQLGFRMSF